MAGDTVVLTSTGIPEVVRVDSARVLWQSTDLENPRSMVAFGDRLLIGDPTRVHLLSRAGGEVRSVGREGEGPGEFRSISAVGTLGEDTVVIFDSRLFRLSYLSPEGEYLGSSRVPPTVPFVNPPRDGAPLVAYESGFLWTRSENVNLSRPVKVALIWQGVASDTTTVLEVWDDIQWTNVGQFIAPAQLFPSRALAAVERGGRVAVGNGPEYCITIRPAGSERPRRICRDHGRARVGRGIRSPDLELLEGERERELLQAVLKVQEIGEMLPSFDALRFGDDGRLWVRTLGEELAEVHPFIIGRMPELGPSHRSWDVFDREGRLIRTVELPTLFDPRIMMEDRIYGFVELPTGEIAIGEVVP